jgi:hypothetical protein
MLGYTYSTVMCGRGLRWRNSPLRPVYLWEIDLSCSGAPVFDVDGKLMAILMCLQSAPNSQSGHMR